MYIVEYTIYRYILIMARNLYRLYAYEYRKKRDYLLSTTVNDVVKEADGYQAYARRHPRIR